MRITFLVLSVFLSTTSLIAQKLPNWYRVYTFDDSVIDMNTSDVILGGDIARITFRWSFDKSEVLRKTRFHKITFRR